MSNKDFEFNKTDLFDDLFDEKFDLSWHKKNELFDKREFSIMDSESSNGVIDNKKVSYVYNKDFFRSDDFIKQHQGLHILFSGCSETEGIGDNIENAWPKILYDRISKDVRCSGFFNLSRSGWGWSRIVLNALIYFKKYGYPDYYFIFLPNNQRSFFFDKEKIINNNDWNYWQKYPEYYERTDLFMNGSTAKEYQEEYVKFLITWKVFDTLCKTNNVKLVFSTWDPQDKINMKKYQLFNNYIDIDDNNINSFAKEYYKNNKMTPYDYRKRDGHGGIVMHHFWANEFYKKYKEIS